MTTPFSGEVPDSAGRISPRHVFETRIRICLQRDSQSLTLQGWTRNLSEGGLNAFFAQALALGEFVTLEIPLPGSGQHVIPAKVVRARGTEYGFQFTALSAKQHADSSDAERKAGDTLPRIGTVTIESPTVAVDKSPYRKVAKSKLARG